MPTYTPEELRTLHPKRFRKEYEDWALHAADFDWTDYAQDECKKDLEMYGIHADNLYWQVSYSQGDGASFDGFVNIRDWMNAVYADAEFTFAEKYPALFIACKQDGSFIRVRTGNRGTNMILDLRENWRGTRAEGIFTGLDDATWDELVEDQVTDADLEAEIRKDCEARMYDFYRTLRDEYEHLTSEDAFVESCICNGVTFEVADHVAA